MLKNRTQSPTRSTSRGRSPARLPPVKGGSYDSELMRILRERDELQAMLDKYERHLSEIQANIKVLTADRDKTNMLYQQAQEEIARLRREVIKSPRAPRSSLTAQSILRRVEAERDETVADLRRMTNERDSLRERLKISQESAINERAHLEQRVEDLQSAFLILEKERGEQKTRQALMKDTMLSLEEEVRALSRRLDTTEEDLTRTKTECSMLRVSSSQAESSLSDCQRKLSTKVAELQATQDKHKQLDQRNDNLLREITSLREEVSTLQVTTAELDKEKDVLESELDDKIELISSLRGQLEEKNKSLQNLKLTIEEVEATASSTKEELSSREREVSSVRRQLDSVREELGAAGKARETLARECVQLREDLSKAKLENQALQLRLDDYGQEMEDLRLKMQDYSSDATRTQTLLESQEKEIREQQESCHRATAQAKSWEDKARQAEAEASSLRLELLSGDSERRRLKDKAEALEGSLEEVLRDLESYHADGELLRQQLASERLSMKNLESLLVANREKEFQIQLHTQEKQTEIQLLRDKLSLADSKAVTQSREVAQARSRASQLEAELEKTKRQLSTERFERERAVQELRRQGLSSSSPTRRSLSPRASWSPERSYLSPLDRSSLDRSPDRSVTFRDF
ncbi:testis-specific gene 10 protein isoform X2 [Lepisosteus oculatus]|uniref:testis-specific gene 10 protein isoform X2 n=1 Tax=Lepisosteus oculatus TaxID=7918 RepID=UPI0035F51571